MAKSRSVPDECQLACKAEQEAWARVEHHLPGDPAHNPQAWKDWQDALHRACEAMKQLVNDGLPYRPMS
jgi:hypothetical protein